MKKSFTITVDTKEIGKAIMLTGFASLVGLAIQKRLNKRASQKTITLKEFGHSLEEEIRNSSNVFIVGHNIPDLDSIGSSIGLYHLVTSCGKKAYIVVDDDDLRIEAGTKRLIDDYKNKCRIIKKKDFEKLVNKDSLLVMTDVNKDNMISLGDRINDFRNIFIIDHHSTNEHTVQTKNLYINEKESSASEIVSKILFNKKIKLDKETATALLAGISLDTKRFERNTSSTTHDVAEKLLDQYADNGYVSNLFLESLESMRRVANLVANGIVLYKFTDSKLSPVQVAITMNREKPNEILSTADYAKVADQVLSAAGVDASFAVGFTESGLISISARTREGIEKVNVLTIMDAIGGGGNSKSAGAKINSDDIFDIEQQLLSKIPLGIRDEETILSKPKTLKLKRGKLPGIYKQSKGES